MPSTGVLAAKAQLNGLTLLSLPKSGRTWLLCLIAAAFDPKLPQDRSDGFAKASGLRYSHDFGNSVSGTLDRLVCSHHHHQSGHGGGVILLERDPRDWIISEYFEHKYRAWMWRQKTLRGNLTENLPQLVADATTYNQAMHDAVRALSCTPDATQLKVVRYESLVACTPCVLAWLLPTVAERAEAASARCDFNALRALNATGKWGRALPNVDQSNKFRAGAVGGWRQQLPQLEANKELAAFARQQIERERRFGVYRSALSAGTLSSPTKEES